MNKQNQSMLTELLDNDSDRMTEWEVEFIESLRVKMVYPWSRATGKQLDTLDQIWRKVFG